MKNSVKVQELYKAFRLYDKGRPMTFQEAIINRFKGVRAQKKMWALQDISFYVEPGTMMGVLGKNGSGKSTLLKILGGVLAPNAGAVELNGRVGGLLELGAGFHPDLTGRENVFVNGVVSGLTHAEVEERFDEIVVFSELQNAIDYPLRTYSSGMRMRLGFAIAAYTDPDILLIDEVLAVGDAAFRQKCFDRIQAFKEAGKTIILVTHDLHQVTKFCDKAMWLNQGKMEMIGHPEDVVGAYEKAGTIKQTYMTPIEDERLTPQEKEQISAFELLDIRVLTDLGFPATVIQSGDALEIEINYNARISMDAPIFSFSLYNQKGQLCCRANTGEASKEWRSLNGRGHLSVTLPSLPFVKGSYRIDIGAYSRDWELTYAYRKQAAHFQIEGDKGHEGVFMTAAQWQLVQSADLAQNVK